MILPGVQALIAILLLLSAYCAAAEQRPSEHVNALRSQLEQLGWRVEHNATGDLLLWPPGRLQASAPTALLKPGTSAAEDPTAVMNLDSLRQQLIDKGWDVRTNRDGSLLLYFGTAVTTPEQYKSLSQQEPDRFGQLKALLHASGWQVNQDQTGNLTVHPRATTATRPDNYAVLQVEKAALDGLSDTLTTAGWRLQKVADGRFRLYADTSTKQAATTETAATGRPVDSPAKARRIAEAWARGQSRTDLVVGRISRVHWVYLVDIFRSTPPYYLHNQLAIRHRDGRVFPLL